MILGVDGIDDNENIKVYPNPTIDGKWQVELALELAGSVYDVYDSEGRIIYHGILKNAKSVVTLDVTGGVYFMRIYTANGNYNVKLLRF